MMDMLFSPTKIQGLVLKNRLVALIGRRGGLARVRRRIFCSVSEMLLNELPECSFVIVG